MTFDRTFKDTLAALEADARAVGMSDSELARASGVSRSTLQRWRQNAPETVRAVTKMQKAIDARRRA